VLVRAKAPGDTPRYVIVSIEPGRAPIESPSWGDDTVPVKAARALIEERLNEGLDITRGEPFASRLMEELASLQSPRSDGVLSKDRP
jgi:hypothetical protein